jgi:ElaB/YqjD/DUF883 family membrane-anchored ribosome-binding protein
MSFTSDQRTEPPYVPSPSSASPEFGKPSTSDDTSALRADLNALREQVADFIAKASADAMKTAKRTTTDVANQVGSKAADVASQVQTRASDLASAASEQAKTFASEIERFGRANPLGAIAGALLVGVVIGLIGRRN